MQHAWRPYEDGSFIRVWHPTCICDDGLHEWTPYKDGGSVLCCRYCRWYGGTYGGRNYIVDPLSGWWEDDPMICRCIYFDRCGSQITRDTRFFARGTERVHMCDYPMIMGVSDVDQDFFAWSDIIAQRSFRRLASVGVPRWRRRRADSIGRFLRLRELCRLRMCAKTGTQNSEFNLCWLVGVAWRHVFVSYTPEDQLRHDARSLTRRHTLP